MPIIDDTFLKSSIRNARGGFRKSTLALLGVGWPPPRGWQAALKGQTIAQATFDSAIAEATKPAPTITHALDGSLVVTPVTLEVI
jgi:hypothetical protein